MASRDRTAALRKKHIGPSCKLFFKQFRYQPEGYCIEGRIADKDEASAFPLGPDIQVGVIIFS